MPFLISGVFYISIFGATIYSFYKSENINQKIYSKFWLIIGIIIPCLVAAFRSYDVGVDTLETVKLLEYSHNYGTIEILIRELGGETDFICAILIYVLSKITKQGWILLFILQLLTIFPITIVAIKLKHIIPVHMIMATYLFLFYNNSLNIMRQSVSCTFIVLAFTILLKKEEKYKIKTSLLFLFAILFHKSAIVGCALVIGCFIISKISKRILRFVIYIIIVFMPIFINTIANLLVKNKMLSERYIFYIDVFLNHNISRDYFLNPFSIYALMDIFLRFLLIVIPLIVIKKRAKKTNFFQNWKLFSIIGFLIFTTIIFSMQTNYGQRISIFFDVFLIPLIPYALYNSKIKQNRLLFYLIIITYWIIWIMYFGWSGSNIYTFV